MEMGDGVADRAIVFSIAPIVGVANADGIPCVAVAGGSATKKGKDGRRA